MNSIMKSISLQLFILFIFVMLLYTTTEEEEEEFDDKADGWMDE